MFQERIQVLRIRTIFFINRARLLSIFFRICTKELFHLKNIRSDIVVLFQIIYPMVDNGLVFTNKQIMKFITDIARVADFTKSIVSVNVAISENLYRKTVLTDSKFQEGFPLRCRKTNWRLNIL